MRDSRTRILFVCLGNICRSPLAEGVFRTLLREQGLEGEFQVDSAGTGSWHNGEPPHPGSVDVAGRHGIDISAQRSRQVRGSERGDFDWWVAMDRSNAQDLQHLGLPEEAVLLLLDFAGPGTPDDVPDPYYEGGFDRTFSLVQAGCQGLLDHLLQ